MKKIIVLLFLISATGFSQILEPVKWSTSTEKISETEYNLVFTATIDNGWHLYSQNVPENGPLPTVFNFKDNSNYQRIGKLSEDKGKEVYEKVFEMKVKYFETKAVFKQRIKLSNKTDLTLLGDIEYMSCNSEKCMPGYEDFEIKI